MIGRLCHDRAELPRPAHGRGLRRPGGLHHGLAQHAALRRPGKATSATRATCRSAGFRPTRSPIGPSCPGRRSVPTCWCRSACRRRTSVTARSAWSRSSWCWASRRRPLPPWQWTANGTCRQWTTRNFERDCSRINRSWTGPVPGDIDPRKLAGIVLDDSSRGTSGVRPREQRRRVPSSATGYRHDGGEDRGKQWARYRPDLPQTGKYEVRLSYSANPNRATNVPVTIVHADGKTTVLVNQRKAAPLAEGFLSLGTFRFEKGKAGSVEISNRDVDGYVIIDAVQWRPVKE